MEEEEGRGKEERKGFFFFLNSTHSGIQTYNTTFSNNDVQNEQCFVQ